MTRWLSTVLLVLGPAAAGAELRGRILVDDKPVAGATVSAIALEAPLEEARRSALRQEEPPPIATTTTKPDGTFTLPVPASASAFRLRSAGGGTTALVHPRVFEATDVEDAGDLTAAKAVVLAGRVVDGQGGPVVAATVTLRAGSGSPFSTTEAAAATTTTRTDGSFKFAEAAESGNDLRVEGPGFATLDRRQLRAGALHRPLVLSPGRAIAGTVRLSDRRTPAAGALVRYEGRSNTRWAEVRKDGTFLVDGIPAEPGVLVADAGERGRASASLPEVGAKASLVLGPTGGLRGRVVDASSIAPLAGIRVVARCGSTWSARSGADGRYEIRGLPPGSCRLTADDSRFVPWERPRATVAAGQTEVQDVALQRAATLSGRVVDADGRPIEGATGRLLRPGSPLQMMRAGFALPAFRSARDGTFKATRLAAGSNLLLSVAHDDYEGKTVSGISLLGGALKGGLLVVLGRGLVLHGLVKDEDGVAVAGAELELIRAFNFQGGRRGAGVAMTLIGGPGSLYRKTTGPDGRFEFKGLTAGDYMLQVKKTGMARERVDPVKVAEGPEGEPLQVVLHAGAVISGFVRDKSGNGVAGFRVMARSPKAGGGGPLGEGMDEPTGPEGAFLLEGLTPGESYDVQLIGPMGTPGARKAGVVAPAEVELQVSGLGQIRGTVADAETGRPLPDFSVGYEAAGPMGGMRIFLRGPGGGNRQPGEPVAMHAEEGAFVLDDVPAGAWDVKVTARGYQGGRAAGVTVPEGGSADGVEVRLTRGGVISGRVVEERTGRVVVDATVRAELAAATGMRFGMFDDAGGGPATDAEGRFTIEGLAPGPYTLTASHPEWTEVSQRVDLKDQPVVAELRLSRGGTITGTVLAGGRGVGAASVTLNAAGETRFGPFGGLGNQAAVSDESGRFRFDRLPPGRYTLSASLRSQSSNTAEAVLQGGDASADVSLVLAQGALIRGTVRGLPDDARANVRVSASGAGDYMASTRTAADGSFELTGAPSGLVMLSAYLGDLMSQGSRTALAHVTIGESQSEATAEIVFQTGFRLDGRVTRGGQPVTDAMVSAFPQAGTGSGTMISSAMGSRTDDNGAFVLEDLQEATYTLMASPMSGGAPIRKTVAVTGDMTVDLEAPRARLAGRVVEADTGRALGDAMVRLEEVQRTPGFGGMTMATSDSGGRFALEDLEPKAYHLVVTKAAYQTETRDVTPSEDGELTVELRRGDGVELVARDGIFGVPLRGVQARVTDAQGASVFMGEVALDSDGRGEIPSLKSGTYALRVGADGYAPVGLPAVTVPSPALTFSLTPGGKVEIQVGPQTQALPNATGRLLGPGGVPVNPFLFSSDGLLRFGGPVTRLPNVAPGRYTLAVDGGARRDFEVTEGASVTVALP